ncbi:MAG: MazG nucleotide pyrophosphohydrolase domain-containing protein [Candidatus Thorarchaeota archaeon]|nr:MAG: nucleotide pyrophosphohydrolase [Candidatus Thorarchaeota archaeon]
MDTKKAQDMIRNIYLERDRARGLERTLLRTFEELGELSDAILRSKSRNELSDEIADVFAWVCSIANLLDIDLSEALYRKYSGVCSKCGRTPCECTEAP